jgi:hypothetical protein
MSLTPIDQENNLNAILAETLAAFSLGHLNRVRTAAGFGGSHLR